MNGAESLIGTLASGGVEICFANPGTSEIHIVAALDRDRRVRPVPVLFEGVAIGAADGYARMSGKPAATLLHLGPGYANGMANLHNARRAFVPMLNIVGDQASHHRQYDAPLTSDIESLARQHSAWVATPSSAARLGHDTAAALSAAGAYPGRIATLIVPADVAWNDGGVVTDPLVPAQRLRASEARLGDAARLLRNGRPTALILGTQNALEAPLHAAGRIAAATGARLLAPFSFARMARGAGRPPVERIPYVVDQAVTLLGQFQQILLVGTQPPAAFFGSPGRPGLVVAPDCNLFTLAEPYEDGPAALEALADLVCAPGVQPALQPSARPECPRGGFSLMALAHAVGALLPEGAIVVDESITSGRGMLAATRGAPPHDWLVNTGGSIGIGTPLSVGAAMACPDRPVLCLTGDGSLMYTLQALWTAARENLRITTVVFANRSYAILKGELASVGATVADSHPLLDIGRPELDFVALAKGLGVPALRVSELDAFSTALARGFDSGGPNLIEVRLQ